MPLVVSVIKWYLGHMLICLVGGAVRDLLLGRQVHDRDFLVLNATPGEFEKRFPDARLVGKTFPVYIKDKEEYAFPRGEGCPSCCCGYDGNDVLNALVEDMELRDFTINSIVLPLPDYPEMPSLEYAWDMVVALPGVLDDLRGKILRPMSVTSLSEDPLRVFRAARFVSCMPDLVFAPELLVAMREASGVSEFAALPAERVGAELRKALKGKSPGRFIEALAEADALAPWLGELAGADAIPAGPPEYHDSSVLTHTARVMNRLAGEELACWMALVHDLGKVVTPHDKLPTHYGHDRRGEELAVTLAERLALPNRFIAAGKMAARWHMVAGRYDTLRPGTRVDMLAELHAARLTEELFRLVWADAGHEFMGQALRDRRTMLSVSLPERWRNRGGESGRKLRELRCLALARD